MHKSIIFVLLENLCTYGKIFEHDQLEYLYLTQFHLYMHFVVCKKQKGIYIQGFWKHSRAGGLKVGEGHLY